MIKSFIESTKSGQYIPFFKMEAQGNDYVYIELPGLKLKEKQFKDLSIAVSKRHFGIGADGLVTIDDCDEADVEMRIFNADGSEAEMCGSALRCIVYHTSINHNLTEVSVKTKSGIKYGKVLKDGTVEVNMGTVKPVSELVTLDGFEGYYIDAGNPHFVTFTEISQEEFLQRAPILENLKDQYYERRNIEFVKVHSQDKIKVKVWERGSGATLACGTGAAAATAAGIKAGLLNNSVEVLLPGGSVKVEYKEKIDNYFLIGKVKYVFEGNYFYKTG
ncbi:MAG: diaminopimelate epimerase [Candidatus Cloacimonetes bacterium]|nr:diaminopimelate epimerase [Candidatus Cloacimonadota bacterium]